jgi:hypothetical protein
MHQPMGSPRDLNTNLSLELAPLPVSRIIPVDLDTLIDLLSGK